MMRKLSVVLGSLVGALAIHGALIACSSGGTSSRGPTSEGTAHADPATAAAACSQWEIKTTTSPSFTWQKVVYVDAEGKSQETSMPAFPATKLEPGWEPIGSLYYSALVRHCVN